MLDLRVLGCSESLLTVENHSSPCDINGEKRIPRAEAPRILPIRRRKNQWGSGELLAVPRA
eukprot:613363-Pelagomonas_calceolata.AAC.2